MNEQNPSVSLEITDALQRLETYQIFLQTKRIQVQVVQKNLEWVLRNKTQATLFDDFAENEVKV